MAEVQVTWTEIPGSKIRLASMAHMALELAMIKAGYSLGEAGRQGVQGVQGGSARGARQRARGQLTGLLAAAPPLLIWLLVLCCCAGGLWKVRGAEEVGKLN